ncbi:glycosyltransferase family 2 protein [Cellulomonas dongxiuzhuiae]|uniref:Glycosyltransferase family 2 protein n=1 Tax=Cellulomonas dongxiuzhuiae TaxID=2819979 RepID=A0ABX8GLJ6_9CELL|nr:glycosyltransferase family 2 protein [Cellulomonas dongxiuzhuiae]MBO3096359.1 glycosyltransferase family 2 protein [Cellulomonas dongxiuzhuiae]QWC16772.1 hypothetical protein KKR89_03760 [Cellulomonas dongxiuzhuiae]
MLVVNYRSSHEIAHLVDSIVECTPLGQLEKLSLSVADNSEDPTEFRQLEKIALRAKLGGLAMHLTDSRGNLGYGAGNNLAWSVIKHLTPDVVIVVNPDVRVLRWDLSRVHDTLQRAPGRMLGAPTLQGDRYSGLSMLEIRTAKSVPVKCDHLAGVANASGLLYPGGHFLAMSSRLWDAMGGFDEKYFLYCEEIDLVMRASRHKLFSRVASSEDVAVAHNGGVTTGEVVHGKRVPSRLAAMEAFRSRVLLYRAHRPLRPWLPALVLTRSAYILLDLPNTGADVAWARVRGLVAGLLGRSRRSPGIVRELPEPSW